MLPLLKDSQLYLTLSHDQCTWLRQDQSGAFLSGDFAFHELEHQLSRISKNNNKKLMIDIMIESDLCRFIVLPRLRKWLEKDALNFLIQQKLQLNYPDFHENNFVILHDQIKFNQPCVVVASPKSIFEKVLALQELYHINSVIPTIIGIWNYYEKKIKKTSLLIEEGSLIYLIQYCKGIVQDIHVYPDHLKQAIQYDDYFNLINLTSIDVKPSQLSIELPASLRDDNNTQALNFMRLSSHG